MTIVDMKKVPFAKPDMTDAECDAVVECLRAGWMSCGKKVAQLEQEFSKFLGDGIECVGIDSGSNALVLALKALGIGAGDEVITTPLTFTATARAIERVGAIPVFVDIDPMTLNLDPEQVEDAVTSETRAILPVHFAGLSCDMAALEAIAQYHRLKIVEDAAHAIPARAEDGRIVGTIGDVTVFSFYPTKPIGSAEGGLIAVRQRDVAQFCRSTRLHGIDIENRNGWMYDIAIEGDKCNMTDIQAAIASVQLQRVYQMHQRRLEIAQFYDEQFADLPVTLPPRANAADHAWHLYALRVQERDRFIAYLEQQGVACSVHYRPVHLHSYWSNKYKFQPLDFPNAVAAFQQEVSLPIFSQMTEDDQAQVAAAVRSWFAS